MFFFFYDALDMCNVTHKKRKTNVVGTIFCITNLYTFGDYEIEFEEYNPQSMLTPMGEVWVRKKELNGSSKLLTSWNEHHPEKQYVYDMYIAAKNRSEGKNYINPFRLQFFASKPARPVQKRRVSPALFGIFRRRVAGIAK